MNLSELKERAKNFEVNPDTIIQNELGIQQFIEKFPLSTLPNLTLEEFAIGGNENSFCYWLEFKKIGFGIGGGNSSKFGIYRTNDDGEPKYATGYGKKKIIFSDNEAKVFFDDLWKNIIQIIKWAETDEIDQIITLEIPVYNLVILKILSIYFPQKFLAIGKPNVLFDCANAVPIPQMKLNASNAILINYSCKQSLLNFAEFKNWPNEKLNQFIWQNFNKKEIPQSSNPIQYWLYSPGERARFFDTFYQEGIMALGWDELGDLNQYASKKEIQEKIQEIQQDESQRMNDVMANFEFVSKVKINDVVIVKRGRRELLGYGIVTSDYYFDDNRTQFKSCRKVDWKIKGNWSTDHDLVLKTLTEISKYKTEVQGFENYGQRLLSQMTTNSISPSTTFNMKHPLNTIFYGPPGTGKTYHTILRSAEIIANRKIENFAEAQAIFQENLGKRIEFITFHQNYSYEDFIQGLRPIKNTSAQLSFEVKDGIFKQIADQAKRNYQASQQKESAKRPFEEVFQEYFSPLIEGDELEMEIPMKKASFYITEIGNKSIDFRKANGGTSHTLSINTLRQMYLSEHTLQIQGLASYYAPLLQQLLVLGKSKSTKSSPTPLQSYVIIIDEINRANISRVFGELITLIEPDKRLGAKHELQIKLPSEEVFCIPQNLYIIGTMNTADKSIALLDIALRRRFDFEAMYPIYEVSGQPIAHSSLLQQLNEEIIRSKGHDFQIGHAYFMDESSDLVQIMNQKVIPLLMEYFMNDGDEVKRILQKVGLVVEEKSWPIKISGKR